MRIHYTIIVVGLLLFSGCQSTTPAKIDNPVVGPPPPRLPADQIRERQLAYEGRTDKTRTAQAGDPDRVAVDDVDSKTAQADRKPTPSGIQRVSLEEDADKDLPRFEDSMVVAFVNEQPIFAGEVLAPQRMALAKAEEQMRLQEGKKFKPEMVYRLRGAFIRHALPRIVETKMLALAAKTEFKKNQLEGLNKAIDKDWAEHLHKMMEGNKCNSVAELEALMAEKDYDLEEHEAAYRESQFAQNYVGFKAHTKFEPTRREMLTYYEGHLKDYEFPSRVHWQQLVISDQAHKGQEGAKQQLEKAVKELLEDAEFTAVVKKYGDGPKAANGGIWDWTIKGSLQNKEIENELFTLPVGETSGVIRTPTGFQIVQVLDRQEAGRKSFESQQKEIEAKLKDEARTIRAKEAIHEIREAAVIKTVFDAKDPEEKPAKAEEAIKRVSASDEQPKRSAKKSGAPKSTAARATVSQAAVTDAPPKESRWKSMFRQKPAVADDNGEMNNISD
ncbi:MAG: PpiC-type peptidyl-prolyl cis-trans isomerase [Planctomycetaceae bacterium]|nr:PpiC-type peptidyl-prolyl cis-trans isomerase [Planctomycetaceae bacterium]